MGPRPSRWGATRARRRRSPSGDEAPEPLRDVTGPARRRRAAALFDDDSSTSATASGPVTVDFAARAGGELLHAHLGGRRGRRPARLDARGLAATGSTGSRSTSAAARRSAGVSRRGRSRSRGRARTQHYRLDHGRQARRGRAAQPRARSTSRRWWRRSRASSAAGGRHGGRARDGVELRRRAGERRGDHGGAARAGRSPPASAPFGPLAKRRGRDRDLPRDAAGGCGAGQLPACGSRAGGRERERRGDGDRRHDRVLAEPTPRRRGCSSATARSSTAPGATPTAATTTRTASSCRRTSAAARSRCTCTPSSSSGRPPTTRAGPTCSSRTGGSPTAPTTATTRSTSTRCGATSRTLYLRFEDSFPDDGWGAWLSHLRLELQR